MTKKSPFTVRSVIKRFSDSNVLKIYHIYIPFTYQNFWNKEKLLNKLLQILTLLEVTTMLREQENTIVICAKTVRKICL